VQLRWASVEDARGVATVHVDAWRAAYPGLVPQEVLDGLSVETRTEGWTRWIGASLADDDHHRLLVAEEGGRVLGWASFGAGRDEGAEGLGELAGLYVHPDAWARSVGRALITRATEELAALGFGSAYLWVLRGNERAGRFYERQGWLDDGGRKTVDGLEELRRSRSLA